MFQEKGKCEHLEILNEKPLIEVFDILYKEDIICSQCGAVLTKQQILNELKRER